MDDVSGALGTIAEFSIGLAGFTGIIAAVTRTSRDRPELQIFRFTNLLVTAFAPGFFSIFSICLIYAGMDQELAIRVSSLFLLFYLLAWAVLVVRTIPRGSTQTQMTYFMWGASLFNMVLQLANLTPIAGNYSGLYLFGLFLLLLQAAVVFTALVLAAMRESVDTGAFRD